MKIFIRAYGITVDKETGGEPGGFLEVTHGKDIDVSVFAHKGKLDKGLCHREKMER